MSAPPDHDRGQTGGPQRALLWGGVALAVVLALGLVLPAILMWRTAPDRGLVLERAAFEPPPEPRLQLAPEEDYRRYLERQRARLDDWQAIGDGRAQIPIEVAIEIMAARGGWRSGEEAE